MASKKFVDGQIDPLLFIDQPLWCVYGYDCFPSIICCKVSKAAGSPAIWGYSVWKRVPGFRTLGQDLDHFCSRHEMARFFNEQEKAIAYLAKITKPKKTND